ncbi:metal-dependent hydrolase family protein [Nocardia goodfellowii]|uniref:Tryptophan 2-monooxygenase n=1 Tax=Nocardia goodfellowii TaxID=882446 RepID=A0ABS4QIP4_9NOCA|nr:amidohydrolase family protein [Nocardia goodfellowii]MBP2191579.1 tryptophan 2-monooxygenase [Nocardia goodfellowii]
MPSSTRFVIVADHCWDGVGSRPTGPTAVVVDNGTIVSVSPVTGEVRQGDAAIVELGRRTLLPGLIDCHVHLVDERLDIASAAYQALRAVPPMRALLANGFTTVRDLGSAGDAINVGLRQAVDTGLVEGPRLFVAPNIISTPGGHGDKMPQLTERYGVEIGTIAAGADQLRKLVREQLRFGADWIKFAASGGFSSAADTPDQVSFTLAEMTAIVDTARDLGLPCAAHAVNDESVRRALRAGVRSIEHASLVTAETLASIAEHGAYLVPTLYGPRYFVDHLDDDDFWTDYEPRMRAKIRRHAEQIKASAELLAASDVDIAYGTDAGMFPHGDNWREFQAMDEVGISPLRTLRAATSVAADLLNRPDLGRIEQGATADLIAVDGHPFTDIEAMGRVEFVMQNGVIRLDPRAPDR